MYKIRFLYLVPLNVRVAVHTINWDFLITQVHLLSAYIFYSINHD